MVRELRYRSLRHWAARSTGYIIIVQKRYHIRGETQCQRLGLLYVGCVVAVLERRDSGSFGYTTLSATSDCQNYDASHEGCSRSSLLQNSEIEQVCGKLTSCASQLGWLSLHAGTASHELTSICRFEASMLPQKMPTSAGGTWKRYPIRGEHLR